MTSYSLRRIVKALALLFIFAILFQIIGEYLLYVNSAEEIEILLKHTEENKKLINTIGGYRSYEINYDQSS
jgi:hypothetical protein